MRQFQTQKVIKKMINRRRPLFRRPTSATGRRKSPFRLQRRALLGADPARESALVDQSRDSEQSAGCSRSAQALRRNSGERLDATMRKRKPQDEARRTQDQRNDRPIVDAAQAKHAASTRRHSKATRSHCARSRLTSAGSPTRARRNHRFIAKFGARKSMRSSCAR